LRRLDEPLREEEVVAVLGADMGNAPPIADDVDRFAGAGGGDLALHPRARGLGPLPNLVQEVAHRRSRLGTGQPARNRPLASDWNPGETLKTPIRGAHAGRGPSLESCLANPASERNDDPPVPAIRGP